jgi:hypothetical protein
MNIPSYSYAEFDYAFAETLYACLMLYLVAFFIRLIVPRGRVDLDRAHVALP